MISPKHCPHCFKRIPLRKRLRTRCPFCTKAFRRRSGIKERSLIGLWLEDRSTAFWFFIIAVVLVISSIAMQLAGSPDLLNFIDRRPVWFVLSVFYAAMFLSVIGRIYFPLLLNAPGILRRERAVILQYRSLTAWGLIVGLLLAVLVVGWNDAWLRLPGTVYLLFVPVALMWAYQALTLTEDDYEDERVWSFLHELGVHDRLEHRHHAYFVLVGLPLSALVFGYFLAHPWLAHAIQGSQESGILAMIAEAAHRVTGR